MEFTIDESILDKELKADIDLKIVVRGTLNSAKCQSSSNEYRWNLKVIKKVEDVDKGIVRDKMKLGEEKTIVLEGFGVKGTLDIDAPSVLQNCIQATDNG